MVGPYAKRPTKCVFSCFLICPDLSDMCFPDLGFVAHHSCFNACHTIKITWKPSSLGKQKAETSIPQNLKPIILLIRLGPEEIASFLPT